MKAIRWTQHAVQELARREVSREEAEQTLAAPDRIVPGKPPRVIYQRRYQDALLGEEMLLRLVVEETEMELVVVTLYKTSKIRKYD